MDWGLNQTYATGDQVDHPDPAFAPTYTEVIENVKRLAENGPRFDPNRTAATNRATNQAGCLILEHELSEESVGVFRDSWAFVKSQGWRMVTLPEALMGGRAPWYQT